MLQSIHIQNYLSIDSTSIDLELGLTCLTGETGAGKSILIDAIAYCLGAKCDKKIIKPGAVTCTISLSFAITQQSIIEHLQQNDIPTQDGICIIRRSIPKDGRSRYFLNDIPCTQQTISQLAPYLIQISGQFQQQSILRKKHHLWLDAHLKNNKILQQVKTTYRQWKSTLAELKQTIIDSEKQQQAQALINYQLQELEEFSPTEGEYKKLHQQQKQLQNREKILSDINLCQQYLQDAEHANCSQLINSATEVMQKLLEKNNSKDMDSDQTSKTITAVINSLKQAQLEIENALIELQNIENITTQQDLSTLSQIEKRLDEYYNLSRKHKTQPEEIFAKLNSLRQQNHNHLQAEDKINKLKSMADNQQEEYLTLAKKLSSARAKSAIILEKKLTGYMQQLAMPQSACKIIINTDIEFASEHGIDQVQMQIKTNPEQQFMPLKDVASGGELSRIVLALTVIYTATHPVPTLIFDEIDSGIGGRTAIVVGKLLQQLAKHTQVLCITHLAQVAACAKRQLQVEKSITKAGAVNNTMKLLNKQQRIEEIARMIGGSELSSTAQEHAQKLIEEQTA